MYAWQAADIMRAALASKEAEPTNDFESRDVRHLVEQAITTAAEAGDSMAKVMLVGEAEVVYARDMGLVEDLELEGYKVTVAVASTVNLVRRELKIFWGHRV